MLRLTGRRGEHGSTLHWERVKPGDTDNSYIVQKLEGHAAVGARMPFSGPYLPSATIAFIRQWITNGAQRPATAAGTSLAVLSRAPKPDDVLSQAPPQIMIGFNRPLDAASIDANSVRIERIIEQNGQLAVERVPARVKLTAADSQTLTIWPASALDPGRYRVASADGAHRIADWAGSVLGSSGSVDVVSSGFSVERLR